ncbi:MAG: malonyl-CoA decarboxylase [Rhodobacter sp.]|nr:malonyl-CoA decarboxylase [Rhodobacter sp.]
MSLLADLLSTVFERRYRAEAADWDGRPIEELATTLIGTLDETSGGSLACQILDRFEAMADDEKLDFLRHVARKMNIDPAAVRETLAEYEAEPTRASYRAFMAAAEPARQELIRRLNQVPGATGRLVRMRADLLRLGQDMPELQALDLDFRHLLSSWFNRGFLVLRPVNWKSPADILDKIIAYEAVHAIDSWDDLRRRLAPPDRRCFAFFHPSMPDEPLIFVEVALTRGVPGSIQTLLAEDRAPLASDQADTAVFYSISNCQDGLAGISFGNSLIKQVAADLAGELAGLKTFATLSPIPGLTRWLDDAGLPYPDDAETTRRVAAAYLLYAKRGDGLPSDPVARFHLGNGALIHSVHSDADTSAKGMQQSLGAMVSYHYDLAQISQNHERFVSAHDVVASAEVQALGAAYEKTAA